MANFVLANMLSLASFSGENYYLTISQFIALTENLVLEWDMAVQNVPPVLIKQKQIQSNISESKFRDRMSIFYSNQEVNRVVGA